MPRISTAIACLILLATTAALAGPRPGDEPVTFSDPALAGVRADQTVDRADLLTALERDREDRAADAAKLVALGRLYLEDDRFTDAETAAQEALDLSPGFAPAHTLLGDTYWRLNWTDSALASYRDAIAADARDPVCRFRLVHALAASGQARDAEAEARRFLDASADAILFVALGEALEDQARLREAFAAYGQAIEADPALATAYSHRAGLFCRQKQYEAAEQSCLTALDLDPDDGLAHAYLGVACGQQQDYWRAYSHAVKAERAGIDMQPVWDLLNRAD